MPTTTLKKLPKISLPAFAIATFMVAMGGVYYVWHTFAATVWPTGTLSVRVHVYNYVTCSPVKDANVYLVAQENTKDANNPYGQTKTDRYGNAFVNGVPADFAFGIRVIPPKNTAWKQDTSGWATNGITQSTRYQLYVSPANVTTDITCPLQPGIILN